LDSESSEDLDENCVQAVEHHERSQQDEDDVDAPHEQDVPHALLLRLGFRV